MRRRAEKMLADLALTQAELSVALVGDEAIAELNRTYRKKRGPTDVLSFPQTELDLRRGEPPTAHVVLGDVVISIDTARRQARSRRRALLSEVTMLLAHGLLHLVGYDHRTDAEEHEMDERTRRLEAAATRRSPTKGRPRSAAPRRRATRRAKASSRS